MMEEVFQSSRDPNVILSSMQRFYEHLKDNYESSSDTWSGYSAAPVKVEEISCSIWNRQASFSESMEEMTLSEKSSSSEGYEHVNSTVRRSKLSPEDDDQNYQKMNRGTRRVMSNSPSIQRRRSFHGEGNYVIQRQIEKAGDCSVPELIRDSMEMSHLIRTQGSDEQTDEKMQQVCRKAGERRKIVSSVAAELTWNCVPKFGLFGRSRNKQPYRRGPISCEHSLQKADSRRIATETKELKEIRSLLHTVQCKLDRLDKEQAVAFAALLRPPPIYYAT